MKQFLAQKQKLFTQYPQDNVVLASFSLCQSIFSTLNKKYPSIEKVYIPLAKPIFYFYNNFIVIFTIIELQRMGVTPSDEYAKKQKVISVISLNYSGILLSPFEFFSKQDKEMTEIETSLSNIYKTLLKTYAKDFSVNKKENKFKWNLGKIDQKMQAQRYSPLYNKTVGIENNRFLDEETFKQKWQLTFDRNIKTLKEKSQGFEYSQSQVQETMQFDLLCYKCLLSYVYKQTFKDYSAKTLGLLNVQKYQEFMEKMFNKSFLNEQKKLDKTLNAMNKQNIDIVFAQEANQALIKRISQKSDYAVFRRQGSQSIIIVKRQKFQNFYSEKGKDPLKNLPDLENELFWNKDTVITFVDNLILISGHLSSKKDKNGQQIYGMIQSLKKLNALYPMCHIIVGCDANSFVPTTFKEYCAQKKIYCSCSGKSNSSSYSKIENQKQNSIEKITLDQGKAITEDCKCFKPDNCVIYPSDPNFYTTSKERTYLQPQISKAEQVARVCRDHLIIFKADDIEIDKTKVCTILDKSPAVVQNLPCEEHPYDHFVIKGFLTVNVMTHFGKSKGEGCFP